jgi:hypothetical protein
MQTFKFEIDRQVTVWYREYHEVKANSMEEAEAIIKANAEGGDTESSFIYQEMIDDSMIDTGDFEILNPETNETILSNLAP